VAHGGKRLGPVFDEAIDAALHGVEGSSGVSDLLRPVLRYWPRPQVAADLVGGVGEAP
jgi:hypothetical protein